MKKLLVLLFVIGLSFGSMIKGVEALSEDTFMPMPPSVELCEGNGVTRHLGLKSWMGIVLDPEVAEITSVTFTVNDTVSNINLTEFYNEQFDRFEFSFSFDACEMFEQNLLPDQRVMIEQFNIAIDEKNEALQTLKNNYFDEDTNMYDTEDHAKEASALINDFYALKDNLRIEVNEFIVYEVTFENKLDQYFVWSYSTDFRGTAFGWTPFKFDWKKAEPEDPTEPTVDENEEEIIVDEDNTTEDSKEEGVIEESKKDIIETPKTGIFNGTVLFASVINVSLIGLVVLNRKQK